MIDLAPEDYVYVTWCKRDVLKKPEPLPFDLEARRQRLKELRKDKYNNVGWYNVRESHTT